MNYHQLRAEAELSLIAWRDVYKTRDERIISAHALGVSKHRIHQITGVARSTIDRAIARSEFAEPEGTQ